MSQETIGYIPNRIAEMPEVRQEHNQLIKNLAPGQLPTELDLALSNIVIRHLSK